MSVPFIVASYVNRKNELSLSYSKSSKSRVLLPAGDPSNNYKLKLFVQAFDDLGGITRFDILLPVRVLIKTNIIDDVLSDSLQIYNIFSSILFESSETIVANTLLSYSTTLNALNNPFDANSTSNMTIEVKNYPKKQTFCHIWI